MLSITSKEIAQFRRLVWSFYRRNGRQTLPWRMTTDPYSIFVSEVMLQQTQVDRVLPKYQAFIRAFPTVEVLATASVREVLMLWSGLGYNRRARYLHDAAQLVCKEYAGVFPRTVSGLLSLPGVGPYTARAIAAFAFQVPDALIETNIRTVYLHHFFPDRHDVPDSDILPLVQVTVSIRKPREWYYALMDYGVHLKKTQGNANRRSRHYVKQPTFRGSNRQLRGRLLKLLLEGPLRADNLPTCLSGFSSAQIDNALSVLEREGLVEKRGRYYQIVTSSHVLPSVNKDTPTPSG